MLQIEEMRDIKRLMPDMTVETIGPMMGGTYYHLLWQLNLLVIRGVRMHKIQMSYRTFEIIVQRGFIWYIRFWKMVRETGSNFKNGRGHTKFVCAIMLGVK